MLFAVNFADVKYESTCNHVFKVEEPNSLIDFASGSDFLTEMISKTVANRLNETGLTFEVTQGVKPTTRKAMRFNGRSTCVKLIDLTKDADIARTCFQTPSSCQRGISASIWLKFQSTQNFVTEVFYSTGEFFNDWD